MRRLLRKRPNTEAVTATPTSAANVPGSGVAGTSKSGVRPSRASAVTNTGARSDVAKSSSEDLPCDKAALKFHCVYCGGPPTWIPDGATTLEESLGLTKPAGETPERLGTPSATSSPEMGCPDAPLSSAGLSALISPPRIAKDRARDVAYLQKAQIVNSKLVDTAQTGLRIHNLVKVDIPPRERTRFEAVSVPHPFFGA